MTRLIAKRLRAARLSCGFYDTASFASMIDLPVKRYERFEQGLEEPSFDDLTQISKITGKSLDFLITGATFIPFVLGGKFWATGTARVFQFMLT